MNKQLMDGSASWRPWFLNLFLAAAVLVATAALARAQGQKDTVLQLEAEQKLWSASGSTDKVKPESR